MPINFLVVTNKTRSAWLATLKDAVASLGQLYISSEKDAAIELQRTPCGMVFVDSAAVEDTIEFISELHVTYPQIPVVVATLSRGWRRTREAMRAGATDYLLKSLTSKELTVAIENLLVHAKSVSEKIPTAQDAPPSASKTTILFADNEPNLLDTSKEFLEKAGYTVITASNPTEAKRKLELGGIDLAILDLRLENDDDERDVSGLVLAKRVARSIPKIIVTSFPSYDYVREALRPQLDGLPGAVGFLARDEGLTALLETVEDILGTVAAQKAGARPKPKVFVAHGHALSARDILSEFLESVGLKPIILLEEADRGDTIIEKFERHCQEADFAIALFTPDDFGYSKENPTELKPRARQNVIFELGYLLAKLGRRRVRVLYAHGVEIPTNVLGFLYIESDDAGKWKAKLLRELKDAGLPVTAKMAI